MITGLQIRLAKAALRWSAGRLAEEAGVGIQTIKRFESVNSIPASRSSTLAAVKTTLENAGIEFVGSPDGVRGILVHPVDADKSLKT
jgi:hypothetical protein